MGAWLLSMDVAAKWTSIAGALCGVLVVLGRRLPRASQQEAERRAQLMLVGSLAGGIVGAALHFAVAGLPSRVPPGIDWPVAGAVGLGGAIGVAVGVAVTAGLAIKDLVLAAFMWFRRPRF